MKNLEGLTLQYFKLTEKVRRIENLEIGLSMTYGDKIDTLINLEETIKRIRAKIYKLL